jgi:hypothetical protein
MTVEQLRRALQAFAPTDRVHLMIGLNRRDCEELLAEVSTSDDAFTMVMAEVYAAAPGGEGVVRLLADRG